MTKKWKPKRWISEIIINVKTGKAKYNYITPKTPEEEKEWEDEYNERLVDTIDKITEDK